MATKAQIIYDVREGLKKFADDTEVDNRYIIYLYNIKRSKYLRRELNNYHRIPDTTISQTFCLPLEEVSLDECSVDVSCERIMRTTKPVPMPIGLHTKTSITKVKPTNRLSAPFNYISKDKAAFLGGSTFKNGIYAFLDNDMHIYVISDDVGYKLLECLSITGIFEDPFELANYSNCCNCEQDSPCFDEMSSEYPLQSHIIDSIREEIINELAGRRRIHSDQTNDSASEEEAENTQN